jgi:adenylyl-sulfate kinase
MNFVLWFTGMSGAGKSTIAAVLKERLEALGKTVYILDGDEVRTTLHKHLGFTPEDIRENNRLIAGLAKELMKNFDVVLVPIISPFRDSRAHARALLGQNFVELFVHAPLPLLEERDTKGLYKKTREGELKNLIGYHEEVPFEVPEHPDIEVKTEGETPEESATHILGVLETKGFL